MRINGYSIGEKYWKKSHGCYFLEIRHPDQRRETRRLDPDADKAEAIRAEIITKLRKAGTVSADYAVRDLCFLFLDHAKANNSVKTYKCYRSFIKSFCSTMPGRLRVRELEAAPCPELAPEILSGHGEHEHATWRRGDSQAGFQLGRQRHGVPGP